MHMYSNPLPCYLMNSQMRCLGRVVFNRCSHKWSLHGEFMILRCTHLSYHCVIQQTVSHY